MVRSPDVPKNDPREVAAQVQAAVLKGESEVLADDVSHHCKAALSGPVEALSVVLTVHGGQFTTVSQVSTA